MSSKAIVPLAIGAIAAGTLVATGGTAAPAMAAAGGGGAAAGGAAGLFTAKNLATAGLVGGTALSAFGQYQQGEAAAASAAGQSAALRSDARAAQAESIQRAIDVRRQGRFASSRALAVGAASGAGTGGSTSRIISEIDAETELRAQLAMYGGSSAASNLRYASRNLMAGGKATRTASQIGTSATLLAGGSSLFERYS